MPRVSTSCQGVAFAAGSPTGTTQSREAADVFPPGNPDYFYLPVDVPRGVNRIDVSYTFDKPTVPAGVRGNACDIGMFGPEGIDAGNTNAFRGWSGGFRTSFTISASDATPGYIPGPITPGRWHVILGPYTIAPQGLTYSVSVTLTYGPAGVVFQPHPAPLTATARQRGRAWYCGDRHLHTVYSDGRRTPDEMVAAARAAGPDFITSTDHNTQSSQLQWGDHATDDLLILNGEEVTTRSGHWPAIGLPPAPGSTGATARASRTPSPASSKRPTGTAGDTLKVATGTPAAVRVDVTGTPGATIQVIDQTGQVFAGTADAAGAGSLTWTAYRRYSTFVRIEVRKPPVGGMPGAMVAMTNPLFLTAPSSGS